MEGQALGLRSFRPVKDSLCPPAELAAPAGLPALRRGLGVAVSLGTPADRRYSQIRIPTCSGRRHYFSLLNSRVTQEQGVGPGVTFRSAFLPRDGPQKGGSRSAEGGPCCWC